MVPPHTPEVIPWSNAQANARAVNETNHQDSVMTSHMPGGKPGSVYHTVAIIGTGNIGSTLAANFAPAARTSSWPAATRTRPGRSPLTSAATPRW